MPRVAASNTVPGFWDIETPQPDPNRQTVPSFPKCPDSRACGCHSCAYTLVASARRLRRLPMDTSISFAALILFLLANTGLLGQPPQRTARSRSIRDIVSELRRFHGEENRDSEVPPEVSRNLQALKHGLRDMIIQTLAEPNSATAEPHALATEVIEQLESEDVPVGDSGGYGVISNIEFSRPTEYPSW